MQLLFCLKISIMLHFDWPYKIQHNPSQFHKYYEGKIEELPVGVAKRVLEKMFIVVDELRI